MFAVAIKSSAEVQGINSTGWSVVVCHVGQVGQSPTNIQDICMQFWYFMSQQHILSVNKQFYLIF